MDETTTLTSSPIERLEERIAEVEDDLANTTNAMDGRVYRLEQIVRRLSARIDDLQLAVAEIERQIRLLSD